MDTSLEQMPSVQSTYTTDSAELEQMAPPQESSANTSDSTTNTTTGNNIMVNETTSTSTTNSFYGYNYNNNNDAQQNINVNVVTPVQPVSKHQDLLFLSGAVFLFTAAAVLVLNLVKD